MTFTVGLLAAAVAVLSFANGANDNFKGVSTLFGSGTGRYRPILIFATVATFAGSCAAFVLSAKLLKSFSAAGLVPDEIASNPQFMASVAFAAGATVLLATRFGLPISTTHALIGALVGAGLAAMGGVNFARLGSNFMLPLAISPFIAIVAALAIYPFLRSARELMGIERESCLCISVPESAYTAGTAGEAAISTAVSAVAPEVHASRGGCVYRGSIAGVSAQSALDSLHFLSAGAVSFARGLNDTPKIAALLLAGTALGGVVSLIFVAVLIALGGWIAARRVAETMSLRITPLNAGQGFTANLITSALVIAASRWGLPVSTTHVSCGALFGIGAATREARWKTIGGIIGSWVLTLPVAAALAGGGYVVLMAAG